MSEYQFAPQQLTAAAGTVTFFVDNTDPTGHTFTLEGTDVDVAVGGDSAARATGELAAGEYRYVCKINGHEMMVGTLVVEPS
jgi:plastocyanin